MTVRKRGRPSGAGPRPGPSGGASRVRLDPALHANRHTLVRRAYLDLIGLPPSPDQVRASVSSALGPGQGETAGHIPFSTDAKKVLELSLREAIRSQSDHIGVEHVLLGLLRDEKSLGAVTLAEFGVDRKHVERDIGS